MILACFYPYSFNCEFSSDKQLGTIQTVKRTNPCLRRTRCELPPHHLSHPPRKLFSDEDVASLKPSPKLAVHEPQHYIGRRPLPFPPTNPLLVSPAVLHPRGAFFFSQEKRDAASQLPNAARASASRLQIVVESINATARFVGLSESSTRN